MNPEFQRNLWLEYSNRRVIFMTISLGLIFLLGNSTFGTFTLRTSAEYAFYVIAVIWGARNAAQAVIGEIRDRTWDGQRLSSLSPFAMTWGKLLGATSFAWFGGALCLVILSWTAYAEGGVGAAVADLCYFLLIGLMAQSVAFFASLLAVRRRQTHSRLDVFFYQVAGLIAAWGVWWAWQIVSSEGYFDGAIGVDEMRWWGMSVDAPLFYLLSLMIFLNWAFIGCLRLMRLELSMQNTPVIWSAFVAFMAFYFAGQEGPEELAVLGLEVPTAVLPLLLACFTTAGLTYIAAFAEPKDPVLYRWLAKTLGAGQPLALWSRLQAWMVAYIATLALGVLLAFVLVANPPALLGYEFFHASWVLSALGLLTRDIAIILFFSLLSGAKRGEFRAIIALIILYYIAPLLLGATGARMLFYPLSSDLGLIGPVIAWGEAITMWFILYRAAGKTVFPEKALDNAVNIQPERK
jgi:hypothetical protein